MAFEPVVLTPDEEKHRAAIRAFLDEHLPRGSYRPALGMSGQRSREFSHLLAERGWVGMNIPTRYGGHQGTAVERYLLAEELFSAGAPISGHWVGDRQTAPVLLAFGTEEQRERFLPQICRGDCWFAIGMSEPDAGSDLAAVRMAATRTDGGWLVNGTKIWTSGATENDYFVVLCRTSPRTEDRHEGLSQLIVDLRGDGVQIVPITTLDGSQNFSEVVLEDVFVPDDMVLGEIGRGWQQVTAELGFERSGPERFLSPYQLLENFLRTHEDLELSAGAQAAVGRLTARFWVIRNMSLSISRQIDLGRSPAVEGAIVKDLGTSFEQAAVGVIQSLVDTEPDPTASDLFEELLAEAILMSPSWTIRGGTTEVLRTVASRALLGRSARS